MADHELVANDTEPPWEMHLDYADVPYTDPALPPLLGTETLTFIMKRTGTGGTVTTLTPTVVDAATRRVRVNFTKAATSTAGSYECQVQIDYPDGRRHTHPLGAPRTLTIHPDLGGPA